MALIVDILACFTSEQVSIYLSEMSEQELGEALDEVELVNAGDRRSKIRRLRNYVFQIKGFSGEGFSDTSSNGREMGAQLTPDTMVSLMLQSERKWMLIESYVTLVMKTRELDGRVERGNNDGQ